MNDRLYVWIYINGEQQPVLCGALDLLQGRRCLFSYDESWLARPDGFALSPDMALRRGPIEPPPGLELAPIFEDAGPDRWGKNVINKVFNPLRRSALEYLELAGEDRIGALGFSRSATEYQVAREQAFFSADLPDLYRAAHALEAHMPIDDDLRRLLRPGASAGGARPKAIIQYAAGDWLAKFPADGDEFDVCALEHASLRLASLCGIDVPPSQLIDISGRNILLVKRFDREHNARLHFASARTMLIGEGLAESDMGYPDLADLARRLTATPKANCQQIFRRMVFNVLIENTDDHEKNHAFIWKDKQWQLAPAYDIQPQLQGIGYHQLRIGKEGHAPSMSNLLSASKQFMLKPREAQQIVDELISQCQQWAAVFASEGVSRRDIDLCANYIMRPALFS